MLHSSAPAELYFRNLNVDLSTRELVEVLHAVSTACCKYSETGVRFNPCFSSVLTVLKTLCIINFHEHILQSFTLYLPNVGAGSGDLCDRMSEHSNVARSAQLWSNIVNIVPQCDMIHLVTADTELSVSVDNYWGRC